MADKALGESGLKKVFALIKTYYASIESPEFTGTPKAPTATAGTSTEQLASTEFVMDAMNAMLSDVKGNVNTHSDLPTDPAPSTGDTYHVDNDEIGTGTTENPEFPSGYYKWNGTEWERVELTTQTVEFYTDAEIQAMWDQVMNPTPTP